MMQDPASFKTREAWLAYRMGYSDGWREYAALLAPENEETPESA